jgi:hypothetical protein
MQAYRHSSRVQVSKGLATGGDGLYGIRVAPTFSNPLLILAATVAIDRYFVSRTPTFLSAR